MCAIHSNYMDHKQILDMYTTQIILQSYLLHGEILANAVPKNAKEAFYIVSGT